MSALVSGVALSDTALRVCAVLGLALAAMVLLRTRSAAIRHWVLASAIACALVLPVLEPLVPSWRVAVPIPVLPIVPADTSPASPASMHAATLAADPSGPQAMTDVATVIGWIWLGGAALLLAVLSIGLARLAWLASRAVPVTHAAWQDQLDELWLRHSRRRPVRLLQSTHPSLLVTWGIRSPKILLPARADKWPPDRIRVVLAHELAHVRRNDWLIQLAAELLRAVHWFNPLVWVVGRRLREESERACDDAVIESGIEPSSYATHLLEVARIFSSCRRGWAPAPAIASPSHLQRRVRAMLDVGLNRRPITRFTRAAIAVGVVAITLPIAALAQASFSTFSGSVFDPMNGLLPRTVLILTNTTTEAKYQVRSDAAGRFEFVGLPPGDYTLEANLPGFSTLRGTVSVTGQDVFQEIRLHVGELEETITVVAEPSDRLTGTATRSRRLIEGPLRKRPLPLCTDALAGGIGGRIRPPVKIRDVRPIYPEAVADARDEEIVHLNALIATDGTVKEVVVVEPAHPVFAAAAVVAVRDWAFDETLLNCAPTEVTMRVSVTFRKE
jgi:TonB family protein